MPTTTNYGWTTPADTDLVKDGAAAIRTLGSSIDTTVFANASAGIPKTIVDAKGDLIAGTASDTVARLAVGSNDQILVADSTAATGMKWATPSGGSKSWSLLNTGGTTLTGSTTTVSGISGKDNLLILIDSVDIVTAAQTISIRFNSDSANNYIQAGISLSNPVALGGNSLITYDSFVLGDNGANSSLRSGYMEVSGANSTGFKAVTYGTMSAGSNSTGGPTGGIYTGTSTISSISIRTGGSTFDGGTIYIYGAA